MIFKDFFLLVMFSICYNVSAVRARRATGFELRALQNGLEPSDWKPMHIIGPGVNEIRIHVLGEWRVIYVAKLRDAIYVLHAFQKKSQQTSRYDIDLARQRYKQIGDKI